MTDCTIRPADRGDVDGIRRVARRAWTAAYADLLAAATIEEATATWYDPDHLRTAVDADDPYLVADCDDRVVGYAAGHLPDDGPAELGACYVDPDDWRRGVGAALLDRFEATCRRRDHDAVRIRVLADNDRALAFYRARGYEPIDERETDLFGEPIVERRLRRPL